jgi:hypothetical protein
LHSRPIWHYGLLILGLSAAGLILFAKNPNTDLALFTCWILWPITITSVFEYYILRGVQYVWPQVLAALLALPVILIFSFALSLNLGIGLGYLCP